MWNIIVMDKILSFYWLKLEEKVIPKKALRAMDWSKILLWQYSESCLMWSQLMLSAVHFDEILYVLKWSL